MIARMVRNMLAPLLDSLARVSRQEPERLVRAAEVFALHSRQEMHQNLLQLCREDCLLSRNLQPKAHDGQRSEQLFKDMQITDALDYLPNDILTKVDRATMAFGLEARLPLLDHRVVEAALKLPDERNISNGRGKLPLRHILAKHVPPGLFERPKHGFEVPLAEWSRTSLRGWAGDLLAPSAIRDAGYFDPSVAGRFWSEHQSGSHNRHNELWMLLGFHAWLKHWNDGANVNHPS